jgi:hypothetical protein
MLAALHHHHHLELPSLLLERLLLPHLLLGLEFKVQFLLVVQMLRHLLPLSPLLDSALRLYLPEGEIMIDQ